MTDKKEESNLENKGAPEAIHEHLTQNKYEILGEDCSFYDYSFKIIVIGNSGNFSNKINKHFNNFRSRKILTFNTCFKKNIC